MKLVLILLLFLQTSFVYSQKDSVHSFIEIGLAPVSYKGDLSPAYSKWGHAFHFGLKLNHRKILNSHFNLFAGSVSASNPYIQSSGDAPNRFFKTTFIGLEYNLLLNLIKKKAFTFYISPGLGLLKFTPKDENGEYLSERLSTRASGEEYNSAALILPLSAGVHFFVGKNFGIGFQSGWLNTTTDYLDNIGMLGSRSSKDNLLFHKIHLLIPLAR